MTKRALAWVGLLMVSGLVHAADIAFVYTTEEIAKTGKPVIGSVSPDGVLAPADAVLSAGGDVLVGFLDQNVKKASLVRLDKDLNIALLRVGDLVVNPEIQDAHRKRALAFQALLPSQMQTNSGAAVEIPPATSVEADVNKGDPQFQVLVNGNPVSKDVVHLKPFFRKSKIKIELTSIAKAEISEYTFKVYAKPKLGFRNTERTIGTASPPLYTYEYKQPTSIKPGKSNTFPLEIHFVDEKDYEVYVDVESPEHFQREKIFVHFD